MYRFALLLPCFAVLPAQAQVYKSVDEKGRVIYSDKPSEGAKKIELPPMTTVPAPKPPEKPAAAEAGAPAAEGPAQKEKQQKLAEAERRLDAARNELAEQEAIRLGDERHNYQKYLDRVQRYRDVVNQEEKAVESLRREAGGAK